jgi:hypothetical protein
MWSKAQVTSVEPEGIRSDLYQGMVRDGSWNPFGTRISDPTLESPKDVADTANCFNIELGYCAAGNSSDARDQWNQAQVDVATVTSTVFDVIASGELFELGPSAASFVMSNTNRFPTRLVQPVRMAVKAPRARSWGTRTLRRFLLK